MLYSQYCSYKAINSQRLVLITNGALYSTFGNDAFLLSMFASLTVSYVLKENGDTMPALNVTHDMLNSVYHEMVTQGIVLLIVG